MDGTVRVKVSGIVARGWLVGVALVAACSTSQVSESVDTGIYTLTAHVAADACSPTRSLSSAAAVGVVASGDQLYLPVPNALRGADMSSVALGSLLHGEDRITLPGCADASLVRAFTVTSMRPDGFDVAYLERWENVGRCDRGAMPVGISLPSNDCQAELDLSYRLEEHCAAPCTLTLSVNGVACACE